MNFTSRELSMPSVASVVIQRETTGWVASFGELFLDEPTKWRGHQRDVWHCCPRRAWTPRPYSGHVLFAGEIRLSTSDQRDRNCGWVWHASVECMYHREGGEIAGRGGFNTEDEAQAAAIAFVRSFCKTALDALPEAA
ncbi:hypothetical protein ACRQ5Q_16695 [Bradyrhizobium sp. PMVTL-01]|uniref:hypothetical protein n=1 Tax=Bradyrhizobium sp. PMVTL-01 TaxID=3434999 RepID=UPI003F71765F